MENGGLRSPRIQVHHEVFVNKDRDKYLFSHRRGEKVREVFRFSSILVTPVPFNHLKILIIGRFCTELDGGGGVLLREAYR